MTPRQRHTLFSHWWPAACAAQDWDPRDRPLRLRILNLALNQKFRHVQELRATLETPGTIGVGTTRPHPRREIHSARELDNRRDIDAVKALLKMLTDDLPASLEQGQPEIGQERRIARQIRDHLQCLAQYPMEKPMGKSGAEAYLLKIARQKTPRLRTLTQIITPPAFPTPHSPIPPIPPINSLNSTTSPAPPKPPPPDREQILYTLNARLNGKTGYRHAAGHSQHTMKTRAGLPCPCAHCRPRP